MWSQSLACIVLLVPVILGWNRFQEYSHCPLLRGPQPHDIVVRSHMSYCDINMSSDPDTRGQWRGGNV